MTIFHLDIRQGVEYRSHTRYSTGTLPQDAPMSDTSSQDLTTQILVQIRDEMRTMRSGSEARFDALDAVLESVEARMEGLDIRMRAIESHMSDLFRRFNQIDTDLKKFAGLANETILHYAGEMDSVRGRLEEVEGRLGISSSVD